MKKIVWLILMAASAVACAQTVTVRASYLYDGLNLANGTLTLSPVNANGQPASYHRPGGGIGSVTPLTAAVENGAFTLSGVPDTALTTPANLCFQVILSTSNGSQVLGAGYGCVQPTANNSWCTTGVCDLDNYLPNLTALPLYTGAVEETGSGNVNNSGTPTAGQVAQWTSSTVIGGVTVSGDCAMAVGGALDCAKSDGVAFGSAAFDAASTFDSSGAAATAQSNAEAASDPAGSATTAQSNAETFATNSGGSNSINATKVNGASVPASANVLGSNSSSQPVSASAAQIVTAIGSTAVTNATNAVNFSGSLTGDVTGTQSATTVGKLNGVALPSFATGYLYYSGGTFSFQTPSGTGTVNNCSSAWALAYYAATGTTVSCNAAFAGIGYFSTSVAPAAATAAQIVTAIGSTAVTNATNSVNFSGSLSGDVTGTQSATSVVKVNGGSVPASANVLGSNSSSQAVSATAAQIVTAIGSTAVANATSAVNFSGSLSGDVTGTQSATTVAKVNGASVPTSKAGIGTNSSGQLVAIAHAIPFPYGAPGGSALSTGILGYITVPFACTITGWSIEADAGTDTVKFLKVAAGTAIPTLGSNSISTSGVSLATGTVIQSTTVTDFTTTTVTANDIIAVDLTTTSGTGYIDAQLVCQ